ncbi:glycosyltransferase involved in cell wall biosynthesis [Ulvibacter sp. MAR_2010_11]|uniref:glycosyltransferase family 2 protein n=1 Tax=Ulvibacter sp. MAR_2010_11 TaxID=1250229 RepID=UPI000C2C71AD|nr:glycosyltransferase family 2 protein [Ulvibacter sp. MAR_2010_11]PKA83760.1 glycosyltransferase involved in cell wall biosynthesis [Ulvibacter sp. MAR_2010_11]
MAAPKLSVIISTYNQPEWLQKVLWGYENQTETNFELIIADDGSTDETKTLIDTFKTKSMLSVLHVWHEDNGFQKTKILNKAIAATISDYLLFSDGDCIPRMDFVEKHLDHRESGYFLSGGYFKLPMDISEKITREDIENGNCFDIEWLRRNGLKSSFKNNKLTSRGPKEKFLNWITPTEATWNGHNSSGWKADIVKVNGFDERMQYGGEDRELGERMFNLGLKAKQLRYTAICVHLDHARGYVQPEMLEKNAAIRKITKREKAVYTPFGIVKN